MGQSLSLLNPCFGNDNKAQLIGVVDSSVAARNGDADGRVSFAGAPVNARLGCVAEADAQARVKPALANTASTPALAEPLEAHAGDEPAVIRRIKLPPALLDGSCNVGPAARTPGLAVQLLQLDVHYRKLVQQVSGTYECMAPYCMLGAPMTRWVQAHAPGAGRG